MDAFENWLLENKQIDPNIYELFIFGNELEKKQKEFLQKLKG